MSLRFALLTLLREKQGTGYELAKQFDLSVSHYWHATPQQIYQELARMEDAGLVRGKAVRQAKRPNKRVFQVTPAGERDLGAWQQEPSPMAAIKSELLVKVYGAARADPQRTARLLEEEVAAAEAKLAQYEAIRAVLFQGGDEPAYLASASDVGPYLTLKRGIMFEQENIAWAKWAVAALRPGPRSGTNPVGAQPVAPSRRATRKTAIRRTPARAVSAR